MSRGRPRIQQAENLKRVGVRRFCHVSCRGRFVEETVGTMERSRGSKPEHTWVGAGGANQRGWGGLWGSSIISSLLQ